MVGKNRNNQVSEILLLLILCTGLSTHAQQQVPLYKTKPAEPKTNGRKEATLFNSQKNTQIVYNVAEPSVVVYKPAAGVPNRKTAVIIAPGGGFHLLVMAEGEALTK